MAWRIHLWKNCCLSNQLYVFVVDDITFKMKIDFKITIIIVASTELFANRLQLLACMAFLVYFMQLYV